VRGATGAGGGENRLLNAFDCVERSGTGAGLAVFGSRRPLHSSNQFLRLKWLADEFIGFHGNGLVSHTLIDNAGHQHDGNFTKLRILLDLRADGITVWSGMITSVITTSGRFLLKLS